MQHYIFPSVIEGHGSELRNVAPDLLSGLKIYDEGEGYVVGELALREGRSPHKAINSSPHDLDYRLLLKTGLLVASTSSDKPMSVTLGFPFATYQANRDRVRSVLDSVREITYDTAPFGGRGKQVVSVEIESVDVLPEIVGAIIGARKGPTKQSGAFFLVSLGFGTFEACLSTEEGILQRTMVSGSGLRYATDLAMQELQESHYLGLRTEHQFDAAFKRGKVILDRQGVDLRPVRRRSLQHYYQDVISPTLRNVWTDQDFERSGTLLLTGGGALYEELVNAFIEEFGGLLDVSVVDNPMTVAGTGYCLRSKSVTKTDALAVGIDIGNAHTVVALGIEASDASRPTVSHRSAERIERSSNSERGLPSEHFVREAPAGNDEDRP